MPFTCVITDHDYATLEPEERVLRPIGVALVTVPPGDRTALRRHLASADAVLSQSMPIDAEVIGLMPRMCGVSSDSLQRAHPGFGAIIRGEPFGDAPRHQHRSFAQLLDYARFHDRPFLYHGGLRSHFKCHCAGCNCAKSFIEMS